MQPKTLSNDFMDLPNAFSHLYIDFMNYIHHFMSHLDDLKSYELFTINRVKI